MGGSSGIVFWRAAATSCATRGDHDIWSSPHASRSFTVPVDIDSRHTANKVLKDAGLPKAF